LGEGPVWDHRAQSLHFVDIQASELLTYRDGGVRRIRPFAGGLSAVFLTATRSLVCATTQGLVSFDPGRGSPEHGSTGPGSRLVAQIECNRPGNRTNDGKCDALGRVWIGTMDAAERAFTGALYRIDQDASPTLMLDDIGVSNGLDWSPDGTSLYYTDSMRRLIWRFPFDLQSGTLGPREVFANVPMDQGCPDGLTVDAEGFVWSAHWDGWRVTRYDPWGSVERVVRLPVPRVTSLCFGGPDLDTLYITSARIGLTSDQLHEAPLSGALFRCQPGVTGRPANYANVGAPCAAP
jgi:sugar lactone lactonase YvrE